MSYLNDLSPLSLFQLQSYGKNHCRRTSHWVNKCMMETLRNDDENSHVLLYRVHFAGTESATVWCGFLNGAVQAGVRAANEVRRFHKPVLYTLYLLFQETPNMNTIFGFQKCISIFWNTSPFFKMYLHCLKRISISAIINSYYCETLNYCQGNFEENKVQNCAHLHCLLKGSRFCAAAYGWKWFWLHFLTDNFTFCMFLHEILQIFVQSFMISRNFTITAYTPLDVARAYKTQVNVWRRSWPLMLQPKYKTH